MRKLRASARVWILVVAAVVLAVTAGYYFYTNNKANADVSGTTAQSQYNYSSIIEGTVVKGLVKGESGSITVKVTDGLSHVIGKTISIRPRQFSSSYSIISTDPNLTFYYDYSYFTTQISGIEKGTKLIIAGDIISNYPNVYMNANTYAEVRKTAPSFAAQSLATNNIYYQTIIRGTVIQGLAAGQYGNIKMKVTQGLSELIGKEIDVYPTQDYTSYSQISADRNRSFYYPFGANNRSAITVGSDIIVSGKRLYVYGTPTGNQHFIADSIAQQVGSL